MNIIHYTYFYHYKRTLSLISYIITFSICGGLYNCDFYFILIMATTDSSQLDSYMDIQQLSIDNPNWQEEADLLIKCTNIDRDDSMTIQKEILDSPLSDAICQVLCELYAEKGADNFDLTQRNGDEFSLQTEMEKLDELLERERITSADEEMFDCSQEQDISQTYIHEYFTKLTRIKKVYNSEYDKLKVLCEEYERGIFGVFQEQPQCIPISKDAIEFILKGSRERTQTIFLELKMNVIDVVLNVKNSILDGRYLKKRRKNFSKQATEVLNEYFYSHLDNPYPPDEVKTDLASQCNITVGQVSNWFGNKRIRYKRNIGKGNSEVGYSEQRYSPESSSGENAVKQELTSSDDDLDEIIKFES